MASPSATAVAIAATPLVAGAAPDSRSANRRLIVGVAVAVVALVVIGFVVLGGKDSTSSGRWLGAVVADPTNSKKTIDVDGVFRPRVLLGDTLLLTDDPGDATMTQVVAVSVAGGHQIWRHDAQSLATLGSRIFIISDGRLIRLDATGKQVGKDTSISVGSTNGDSPGGGVSTVGDRLALFDDNGTSIVDPDSLKVLARDVSVFSCSEQGAYCARQDFDSNANETDIVLVQISSGKTVGTHRTVNGNVQSFATDDGKLVLLEDGDLEVFSKAGKQLSRNSAPSGSSLQGLLGSAAVLVDTATFRVSLYSINADATQIGGRGPAGYPVPTSQSNLVLIMGGNPTEVNVCSVGPSNFDCSNQVRGSLAGAVNGVFYVQDGRNVAAYRLSNSDNQLWSLRVTDSQTFTALDGKVAVTTDDFNRSTTTIDVYG